VNGIKLQGQIDSFDQFVVLLKNSVSQMVYKHAISTVVRRERFAAGGEEEGAESAVTTRMKRRCLNVPAVANVLSWCALDWEVLPAKTS
jgi:hypothetical protein